MAVPKPNRHMRTLVADKIKIPAALWEGLKRVEVDRATVARWSNLPLGVMKEDTPVTTQQWFRLWQAIEVVSDDAMIGIRLATALDGSAMPLAFHAAYHARDLRDALNRVARFKSLCAPEVVSIIEDRGHATIAVSWPHASGEAVPASLVDASMASIMELGRRGTSSPVAAVKVELARTAKSSALLKGYYGCSIKFGVTDDRLILRSADLDRSFGSYNQDLLNVLTPELERRLGQQSHANSVRGQVEWVLRRRLTAGRPDIRSIASELAMSERSLQRRLADEGSTFQALLGEIRRELALEYLADSSVEIMEVAYLLGYEDQNSFFRAFRQWEDTTPTTWRTTQGLATSRPGQQKAAQ